MAIAMELLDLVAADLVRERELTPPVIAHITADYNFSDDQLHRFFAVRLPSLEEYEVELTFSRLFTPDHTAQVRAGALIDAAGLSCEEETALVEALDTRRLTCVLREGARQFPFPVGRVLVERYVRLLNLRAPLAAEASRLIDKIVPEIDRETARFWCRQPQWQGEERIRLLGDWLAACERCGSFTLDKLAYLTGLVKTYRPHDAADLDRQLTNLTDALDNMEISPFFNDELEEIHGAQHEASEHAAARRADLAREKALTTALRDDLEAMQEAAD